MLGAGGNKLGVQGFMFLASEEGAFAGVPVALAPAVSALFDDEGCLLYHCVMHEHGHARSL